MILNFFKTRQVGKKRIPTNFEQKIKNGVKIHTIREDSKNRWKNGKKIHFSTGARSSNYKCFKEGICVSTQNIEINYPEIWIDGRNLNEYEILELAINDGFDDTIDFWNWFEYFKDFRGKIIHWTNLKYEPLN